MAIVLAAYLFFAGHNQPGGGFAAGLVLGAVVWIRSIAGLRTWGGAVPLLAGGGVLIVLVSIAPMFFGRVLLDQAILEFELPLLGKVKTGTAALFDAGVTAIVVGLVVVVFDALAELDGPSDASADAPADAAQEGAP
jgi:multicomponent Na+:H+ antiporter subunit A